MLALEAEAEEVRASKLVVFPETTQKLYLNINFSSHIFLLFIQRFEEINVHFEDRRGKGRRPFIWLSHCPMHFIGF